MTSGRFKAVLWCVSAVLGGGALVFGALVATRYAALTFVSVIAGTKTTVFEELRSDVFLFLGLTLLAGGLFLALKLPMGAVRRRVGKNARRICMTVAWSLALGAAFLSLRERYDYFALPPRGEESPRLGPEHGWFTWGFTGHHQEIFPHTPGIRTENRFGYEMLAHIGADGIRWCNTKSAGANELVPPPTPGVTRVALIGDSFIFGVGLKDDETLCWKLREKFEISHPGKYEFLNIGQPGSNVFSFAKTVAHSITKYAPDLIVAGSIVHEDSQPFDVNHHYFAARWFPFQVLATILHPDSLVGTATLLFEFVASDFVEATMFEHGSSRLVDAAVSGKVPLIFFLYAPPEISARMHLRAHVEKWVKLAAGAPGVTFLGSIQAPNDGSVYYIPGDGHPTPEGNTYFSEALTTAIIRVMEGGG